MFWRLGITHLGRLSQAKRSFAANLGSGIYRVLSPSGLVAPAWVAKVSSDSTKSPA